MAWYRFIFILQICFSCATILAQEQFLVEGDPNSTDTVASIRVNSTAFATDVVGLSVSSNATPGRGVGSTFFGGGTALKAHSRQFSSIISTSENSFGMHGIGSIGAYFKGVDGTDIMLGASAFRGSGADEGVIRTQLSEPSSDLFLVSNDAVIIDLDEDADEEGSFEIHDDANASVFIVTEGGQVESGHIEIKGLTYDGMGGDESVIESDQSMAGSDLWLISNDAIVLALDHNNDEEGHLEVKNGEGSTVAYIDENGTLNISGEINHSEGGGANMIPICYGSISSVGIADTGSGNFIVLLGSGFIFWIEILGHDFDSENYFVMVSPKSSYPINPSFWSWDAQDGLLQVISHSGLPGTPNTREDFSFVVFKL